jgi:hypothetical protein
MNIAELPWHIVPLIVLGTLLGRWGDLKFWQILAFVFLIVSYRYLP